MLSLNACHAPSPPPAAPAQIVWRDLGTWSGRGNKQTESFTGETGALRVRWTTRREPAPGQGAFELTIHSAISGRPLQVAVDHRGNGQDTTYVQEDPRIFFAVVESADIDWEFTIDEAVSH